MEFLFGALVAIVSMSFAKAYLNKHNKIKPIAVPQMTQSQKYDLVKPVLTLTNFFAPEPLDTQSIRHYDSKSVKVLFTEGRAYWISNNAVYAADISDEGTVEEESTEQLDIIGMDSVELEKISFIVEKLTEGKRNDSWGSGNS